MYKDSKTWLGVLEQGSTRGRKTDVKPFKHFCWVQYLQFAHDCDNENRQRVGNQCPQSEFDIIWSWQLSLGTQKSVSCPAPGIDRFHTRGKKLCKFLERKESFFYIRKEFNPHRNFLVARNPNCPLYNTGVHVLWQFEINLLHFFRSHTSALKTTLQEFQRHDQYKRFYQASQDESIIIAYWERHWGLWFILTCYHPPPPPRA